MRGDPFYLFAWESILPNDEVAYLKVELREKGRIDFRALRRSNISNMKQKRDRLRRVFINSNAFHLVAPLSDKYVNLVNDLEP
ncbi:hypothetical protein FCULG_00001682 [Fusarium culmorum]|uniref:Uncharacterized protein n=1 Tax=Fusarium culmorum TaxID=5516 RepID=A0A2T4GJQ2_FUSCU|nr:hypothetical protein FCULG_00001682 [Fusarium culmorum]